MINPQHQRTLDLARDALLAREPKVAAIYVYGSLARGDAHPDSDLDLAVILPPGQKIADKLGLVAVISRSTGRDVDIVNLRETSLDLIREVLRDGQLLFDRNRALTLAWEAEHMTDYCDFKPRRAAIEEMYLRGPLRISSP